MAEQAQEQESNFNFEKFDEFTATNPFLVIKYTDESLPSTKIPYSSFSKIMAQIETPKEEDCNFLNFTITITNEVLQSQVTYQVDEKYILLLERTKYLFVLPPGCEDLDEEEKVDIEVACPKSSMEQILKLAGMDKVLIFYYLEIVTQINSYEMILMHKRKRRNVKQCYLNLLDHVMTYNIKNGDKNCDVSKASLLKIVRMCGLQIEDILDMMKINVKQLSNEERKLRNRRLALLKKKSSVLMMKKMINNGETGKILIMANRNDYATKSKKKFFDRNEKEIDECEDLINSINKQMNDKKENINNTINDENNTFILANDVNNKPIYIRRRWCSIIKELPQTDSKTCNINNYEGQNTLFNKESIINPSEEQLNDEYVVIEKEGNKLLVKKNDVKNLYDNWKTFRVTKKIKTYVPEKEEEDITLKDTNTVKQEEIGPENLPPQEEDGNNLNKRKEDLLNRINEQKITYIEYEPQTIFNSSLYDKVNEHKGEFDNYTVPHANKENIVISKKKLLSKPKDDYEQYIIIKYIDKTIIVSKKKLIDAISKWDNLSQPQKIKDNKDNEEEIDLRKISVEQISDEELPYQPEESRLIKEQLDKELSNEDNELIEVHDENENKPIIIKKCIYNIIRTKTDNKDFYEVPICDEEPQETPRRTKVSKKKVLGGCGPIYVETTITEKTKKRKCFVTKKSIVDGLNSPDEDIELTDNHKNTFKTKKSNIQIEPQQKEELPKQSSDLVSSISKDIPYTYSLINDEDGNKKLVRKEYVKLIKEHQPKTKFDRYELPDCDTKTVYLSRKELESNHNENEFVPIKSKTDDKVVYVNRKDFDPENHNEMTSESYPYTLHDGTKKDIKAEDVTIVKSEGEVTSLPAQPEEKLMEDLNNKKAKIKEINDNNEFVEGTSTSNKKIFILMKYINEINKDITEYNSNEEKSNKYFPRSEYIIKDYNNNTERISADSVPSLVKGKRYIPIKVNDESALIEKENLSNELEIAENPRYKFNNVINKKNDSAMEIASKDFTFEEVASEALPGQEELVPKKNEEEEKMMNDKKDKLLNDINAQKITYIDYEPETMINNSLYDKVKDHKGEYDNYTLPKSNKENVVISKKKLISKPKNDYEEYIVIKYMNKDIIVNKKKLITIVENWKEYTERPKVNNHSENDKEEEVDLMKVNVVPLEDEALPYQPEENKLLKEKFEALISNENNNFIEVEDEKENKPVIIKKSIFDIIKNKVDAIKKDIYEIPVSNENNGRHTKVSKRKVLGGCGPIYVETTITEKTKKRKCFVTKKSIVDGLNSPDEDIILIDNHNNKIKTKKSNLHFETQEKEELPPQSSDIIHQMMKEITYTYVIVIDEEGNNRLIRKEYVDLIKFHQPKTKFDRYEVPDFNNKTVYLSRRVLEQQESFDEYVFISNKSAPHQRYYLHKTDFTSPELHTELIDEPYEYTSYEGKKVSLKPTEIEIIKSSDSITLPYQPEEKLMEDLLYKKKKIKEENDNTDYIAITNISNQTIYILKKYITDINHDIAQFNSNPENNVNYIQRKEYKVIDYSKNPQKISISILPTLSTSKRFISIVKNAESTPILVDKDILSEELQVADNPRYTFRTLKNINTNAPLSIASKDFTFEERAPSSLPKQDELISKKTIKVENKIERVITNNNMIEEEIKPQGYTDEVIEVDLGRGDTIKEEEVKPLKALKGMKPKPKKPTKPTTVNQVSNDILIDVNSKQETLVQPVQKKEKKFFVIRRAVIRRIRTEG